MCVRVIINVTQCYIPMYTLETLDLSKVGSSLFGHHKTARLMWVTIEPAPNG